MSIKLNRKSIVFYPNPSRTIARFYFTGNERALQIIQKVLQLSPEKIYSELQQVLRDFSTRHRQISKVFKTNFNNIRYLFEVLKLDPDSLSNDMKLFIGSYFTHEYSVEAAAYFNPSIVEHPDQYGMGEGDKRIIVSFRATGEGHISSIVFKEGVIDANNNLHFSEYGNLDEMPECIKRTVYSK